MLKQLHFYEVLVCGLLQIIVHTNQTNLYPFRAIKPPQRNRYYICATDYQINLMRGKHVIISTTNRGVSLQ